ncbi:MAG: GNAT family N-acetyltransferase [Bryobacteraceae bacterium]|jgi:ribosomal protein S18 acetylase RimI-like enzyme
MAARLNPVARDEIVDLRLVAAADLDPVLEEEVAVWHDDLEWDFAKSAQLARRFVGVHALSGRVLVVDRRVAGYVYFVFEDHKALLGDLYILHALRTQEREDLLLRPALDEIFSTPHVTRIEAQLLMLNYAPARVLPRAAETHQFCRNFMRADLKKADLGEGTVRRPFYLENWSDRYSDAAAALIAESYAGHVDGWINDQYRSPAGAHRFLHNIVAYPGCGTFSQPASYLAFEGASGSLCGLSLTSLVSAESGHITQICVSPSVRGTGIGHALLRQSLLALRNMECRSVGLTVTAANENAVALYERVGFRTIRQFSAYAWDLA